MIIEITDPILKIKTFTDSRLQGATGMYCLCTRCSRTHLNTDKDQSAVCQKHDDFIKAREVLQVSAPIFSCPDYKSRPETEDLLLIGLRRNLKLSSREELTFARDTLNNILNGDMSFIIGGLQ